MSTYTDLHTRRRENLTILRKPGTPEDGITPQRVIFANPENIYEGTFKGKIEAVGVSFTSVDLTDVTINGGKIKDATIYSDGREMSIVELTSNVSDINGKLDDAIENITSAQISCGELDKRINDLISGESGVQKISAVISVAVDYRLSSLSSELCDSVDYRLSSLESRLSNQISGVSSLLSGNLISETSSRIDGDKILSDAILSNKAEIDDLWKNIRGGLNYIDNLSVAAAGYDTVNHAFVLNKSDGVTVPDFLREGFFWTIKTIDKNAHYFIEGLEVEHGDWFIVKNSTPLSDVTSADIAVFDAQDFDNFKLSGDNNVVGNNTFAGTNAFTGNTTFSSGTVTFEDDVDFVAKKNVVVESNIEISGMASVKDLVVSADAILTNVSVDNASVKNATVQVLSAASFSIELSNLKYGDGLSTMEQLTSNLQEQLTSAQLSIDGISSCCESLEKYANRISGDLSTLSGELRTISGDILLSSEGLSAMLSGLSGEVSAVSSYLVSAINLSASKPLTDLSGEVSAISSMLTSDISYLSSELSDYHNTLNGIDRESDETHDIRSDNLILTDVNLYGGTEHSHNQYYMTFISGTVVLKPIAK